MKAKRAYDLAMLHDYEQGEAEDDANWLAEQAEKELEKQFQWRDKNGGFHNPSDMETRHVFYTLRMIWNHTVPDHMSVGGAFVKYSLGPFYTPEYLSQAVSRLAKELSTRNDLTPYMKLCILQISGNISIMSGTKTIQGKE